MIQSFRWIGLLLMISMLTGCFYWMRAYQTYLQMDEFDEYFSITAKDEFSIHFKEPRLYSDDFISLSKVHPSTAMGKESGKQWRYLFRKVDKDLNVIQPGTSFFFELSFNSEDRLIQWVFSPLFLQIAPAEFLEVSLRSIGGAEINKDKRQLKANTDLINKISADLPKKKQILSQLGEPLEIKDQDDQEVYLYHFLLETNDVEKGYEDRALSKVDLTFDKKTDELIKMAGRFVGLKISIKFRNYLENKHESLAYALGGKTKNKGVCLRAKKRHVCK